MKAGEREREREKEKEKENKAGLRFTHSACAMKAHIVRETRGRSRLCVRIPRFRGFIFHG